MRVALLHSFLPPTLPPPTFTTTNTTLSPSALRAYNTYISPSESKLAHFLTLPDHTLEDMARRKAAEIDFLQTRHVNSRALRNSDPEPEREPGQEGDNGASSERSPLTLVLYNLRSAQNVGSIARTASGLNCRLLLVGYTPPPDSKVALGSDVVWDKVEEGEWMEDKEWWEEHGVYGLETYDGAKGLYDGGEGAFFVPKEGEEEGGGRKRTAFVLGNEVTGLPLHVLGRAHGVVEVPMIGGGKNSLNVAVCAGVVGYEWLRRWKFAESKQITSLFL